MPIIKLNNRSIKDVTSLPFGVGNLIHIQSQTASNSASISFTTGINGTYKEYQFYWYDILAKTNGAEFTFNLSTDSGSNYNVTKTTTVFQTWHAEDDSGTSFAYQTGLDLAQGTGFQTIANDCGNGADESSCGNMQLFNPASTVYVKHFISVNNNTYVGYSQELFTAGYGNTTSAINAVRFQMSSGNFDGTIAMFGVL